MKCSDFVKSAVIVLFVCSAMRVCAALDIHRPDEDPRYSGAQPNEWTMDYEAALAYADANNLNTIVMFSGSWWCPHCQALEDGVLGNPEWLDYINANPVMLVFLDFNIRPIYNLPRDHPYNKCFLWDPDYLTANGLSEAEGDARLAYNYALQDEYCTPSMFAFYGYSRVGYPTWVVLRSDGTRCARVMIPDQPTPAVLIRRYEQALLADPSDEMDDEALMNPAALLFPADGALSEPLPATLSENDLADNYSFTADPKAELNFYVDVLAVTPTALKSGTLDLPPQIVLPSTPLVVSVLKSDGLTVLHEEVITPAAGAVSSYRVPYTGSFYLKISPETAQTNLVGYSLSVSRVPYSEENNMTRVYKYKASLKTTKPLLMTIKPARECIDSEKICYRERKRRSLKGYLYFCGGCTLHPNALVYFTDSDTAFVLWGGDGSAFEFLNIIGKKSRESEGVLAFNVDGIGLDLLHGGQGAFRDGLVSKMSGSAAGTIDPPICNSLCEELISVAYDCDGAEVFNTPDAIFGSWSIRYSSSGSRKADEQSALLYFKDKLPKYIQFIVQDGVVTPRDEWLTLR